ncbi:Cytochrome b-c1 complex subunit 2 [Podosphaera aphanis]|nr:Cytochrome b-c1 complex subunit 2 [Podosphaera aphanis]
MIPRSLTGINAQRLVRASCYAKPIVGRSLSAISSESNISSGETANVAGILTATKDIPGPTTKLAVVAKAGTRYQPAPGLSTGLELFAFKNTHRRSALRITREAELLGGQLASYHTRESVVIEAKFLRENLPYFTELLAEVISQTKFTTHEFDEQVTPLLKTSQSKAAASASEIALDSAHSVAFHHGLGASSIPNPSAPLAKYLNEDSISQFASSAYSKSNIAVVAHGSDKESTAKWVGEFFKDVPGEIKPFSSGASKYFGGEERINHPHGNSIVLAFPGSSMLAASSPCKPEIYVLSALLGGKSTIKWSTGFSLLAKAASSFPHATATTSHFAYSDAGLLTVQLSGEAQSVRNASLEVVKVLKSISEGTTTKEDLSKAIAQAKFRMVEEIQDSEAGIASTGIALLHGIKPLQLNEIESSLKAINLENIKAAAKGLLAQKATISAVGDLHVLPYADEIGLKV